ncbi:hypothetical protein H8K35_18065 [Undibacterium sp. LX40W]|uniref:Lipoprotein n=1 Tax=Undibacterium nitidum TaxID=2762298 RepID=A0A923HV58_9BURK|nr:MULTISPECIES: hypothetical protein [Undibacterium]MBC3883267.1 hypothetical protein [Undibacterium nitidum]MBC3893586.1 hypothetical protein [Undibacterium sp. LX40W]
MQNKFKSSFSLVIALVCFYISSACLASDNTSKPSDLIRKIEGVYKHRFGNGLVSGEKYQSEDIVEIVSYSEDAIYFRASLQFYNGHTCGISGIAKFSNDAFVYQSDKYQTEQKVCTLKISSNNGSLNLTDRINAESSSSCSAYCGARGSLANYDISLAKKRNIRYMPLILKSRQYVEAVEEYQKENGK